VTLSRGVVVALAAASAIACRGGCRGCENDEAEEQEELDLQRDHFWRAQISIVGRGRVRTFVDAFDCTSDGATQHGDCGPKLVRFKELAPPTMEAHPAPGWRFDHWDSLIRDPDGATHRRSGPMPDGIVYLNGFGYADTGQLETVTCVFVADDARDAQEGVQPLPKQI
jgi:hypothetical protein